MASAIPSLLVAYEGDTGLMGFTSTSQGFFMLGSGPNLNNVSADNLAVGDDFDWQFSDTGTTYSYDFYSCDFTSTNVDCIFACATDDPVTSINTSVTAYYGLAGSLDTLQSTEANAQVTVK